MNFQTLSPTNQTYFFPQRLPLANIVKPRILLNRSPSPINTYTSLSNHLSSPTITAVYRGESPSVYQQNHYQKPIFYSPNTDFQQNKPEPYQRNLSPQASLVLDILNKIKSTNIYRKNKSKISKETQNMHENKQEVSIQQEITKEIEVIPEPEIQKSSTFKRSCGCSPRNSPKNRQISPTHAKIDKNSNIPDIFSDLNQINVYRINPKSPKTKEKDQEKSPIKPILSPKNKSPPKSKDLQKVSFVYQEKNTAVTENESNLYQKEENLFTFNNDFNKNRQEKETFKKSPPPKQENELKTQENELKTQENCKKDAIIISNSEKTETSQATSSIQDLLGKINQCLSKTSYILNNKVNEKEAMPMPDQENINDNPNNGQDHANTLQITTSPVKEFQVECNGSPIMTQINEITRSLEENFENFNNNGNNIYNLTEFKNKGEENRGNNQENSEFNGNSLINTINYANITQNNNTPDNNVGNHKEETDKTNEESNQISEKARFYSNNFSPIIERSEKDEDKENNSPFINIYTQKLLSGGVPLSPKEAIDSQNHMLLNENSDTTKISSNNSNNKDIIINEKQTSNKEFDQNDAEVIANSKGKYNENEENPTAIIEKENDLEVNWNKRMKNFENNKKLLQQQTKKNPKNQKSSKKTTTKTTSNETKQKALTKTSINIAENKISVEMNQKTHSSGKISNKNNKTVPLLLEDKGSYSKIAQKVQSKRNEQSDKNMKILKQINEIDEEIQSLEKESQKARIDLKMTKFYDNYKAYRHKLPSIQENEDSVRKKTQLDSPEPKFQQNSSIKQKNSPNYNKIVEERCNYLYTQGIEASKKRQKEREDNQKKTEQAEKSQCTFKPEFIAKKNNDLLLSNREKPFQKPIINKESKEIQEMLLLTNNNKTPINNFNGNSLRKRDFYREEPMIQRARSQNNLKRKPSGQDTLKMNKSMSPQKNLHSVINRKKATKSQSSLKKTYISPRSTTSTKTLKNHNEKITNIQKTTMNSMQFQSPLLKKSPEKRIDKQLNCEIFDILKIFSGINEVLAQPSRSQMNKPILETLTKESSFEKIKDISPIKSNYNEKLENNNNKSFTEASLVDMGLKNTADRKGSLDHLIGLLDEKHQHLLMKSIEMTKKVELIFKENSSFVY